MSLDSYKCHCSFTLARYIVASYPDLFQFLFILVLYVYRRDYIMNITLNGGGGEGRGCTCVSLCKIGTSVKLRPGRIGYFVELACFITVD